MPNAGNSLPSESTSIVAHCLAVSTGSRSPRLATFMPNLMRRVPPARAAMTLMHSSPPSAPMMRSDCQIESTPPASHRSTQRQKPRASSKLKLPMPTPALMVTVRSSWWCGGAS